jgi:hypothetical protein
VSGQTPTTYIPHGFVIGIILIVGLVLFLHHQWG